MSLELTGKQRRYINELSKGKTKYDSAIAAGYSHHTAVATASHIDNIPAVRNAFAELIRKRIPPEKIAQRIEEGLDAQKTEFAKFEGKISDQEDCVDYEQRRKYAELAAVYGGYHVPKQELDVNESVDGINLGQLEELLAKASL